VKLYFDMMVIDIFYPLRAGVYGLFAQRVDD